MTWEVVKPQNDNEWAIIDENGRSVINEPNARLIAAAPDLLEALRGLLDGLAANYDERLGLSNEQWEQRIKDAKQAIAKAEGGDL